MNYTTKSEVQNYLKRNIDTGFDTQLTTYIEAMSQFADNFVGCTLVDATPSTRKYDGSGETSLLIDDCHTITEITVDGASVLTDVVQYPANQPRKNTLKLPYTGFPEGNQNVEVTGVFARFTSLPAELKYAVTVLVAGIVNQVDNQTDGVKSEKVGEYQVTYTDGERKDYERAMAILKSYRPIFF